MMSQPADWNAISLNALRFVCRQLGKELHDEDANAILSAYAHADVLPDAKPTIEALKVYILPPMLITLILTSCAARGKIMCHNIKSVEKIRATNSRQSLSQTTHRSGDNLRSARRF